MSDEQRAVYGEALAGFDERLASAEDSEDPAEVADKVVKALTAGSPEERYVVGRGARTLTVLRPLDPGRDLRPHLTTSGRTGRRPERPRRQGSKIASIAEWSLSPASRHSWR